MTLSQISEILAERAGRQFDIPFRKQMEDHAIIWRARLLTNSIEKRSVLKKYYSNFIILDLEEVSKDECDELEDCGCENVLRTVQTIPQVLVTGVNPFDYFGSKGGAQAFGYTTFASEKYLTTSKYTGKKARYNYINQRGYVFNEKNIEKIRIEDVWSDPRVLVNYSCSTEEFVPCYTSEGEVEIDEALTQLIINSILTTELRLQPLEEKVEIKTDKNV